MRKNSLLFLSCLPPCISAMIPSPQCFAGRRVALIQGFFVFVLTFALGSLNPAQAQKDVLSVRKRSAVDKSAVTEKSGSQPQKGESAGILAACTGLAVQQVDATSNPLANIVQSLVGPGVAISNISTNLPLTSDIYGSFSCGSAAVGIEQGLLLTTGSIANAKGPNSTTAATRRNRLPGNALLDAIIGGAGSDAGVVSFDITPMVNSLTFKYVFASEEYNEYVSNTGPFNFNDLFGFFISGPGITGTQNIALVPGTAMPVRVSNVNKGKLIGGVTASNPGSFINNDDRDLPLIPQSPDPARYANLEYDGLTVPLTATITVIPGQTYTLTLAIEDTGDGDYDSGVFIEGGNIPGNEAYYSKPAGDLHNVLTWGANPDGSGASPADFGPTKTFNLANRPGVYTLTADWRVAGPVNLPSGSRLQINGYTLSITSQTGGGTFSGSLTSNLTALSSTLGGVLLTFTPGSSSLNNLTVNAGANATLGSVLDLYNTLTVQGFFRPGLSSSDAYLTFKSGPAMTARVAPVTGTIDPDAVRTETYIPARRAWRMMNLPLSDQPFHLPLLTSVFDSWQESRTTASPIPNPFPGYGTHITGGPVYGSVANGFDQDPGAAASIKKYTNATNTWEPLASTTSETPHSPKMIFIRGDRGIPLGLNTVPPTVTRLRGVGEINVGNKTYQVNSTGFTAVPNPYLSPVNFATLTRVNVQNNFYVWDPKMGGTDGVGAYVLLSYNGSSYDVVPASVSPESQYIQTAQSFMVRPEVPGTPGIITFRESDKVAVYNNVFRTNGTVTTAASKAPVMADPKSGQGLRITLEATNPDQTAAVLDEAFTSYKSSHSNKIDNLDAVKMTNEAENLAIVREGQALMLDRRALPQENDVMVLKLWNTAQKAYLLEINPVNLSGTGLAASLEDSYLKTSTPVSLKEKSQVPFRINSDAASAAASRFRIVISKGKVQPDVLTVPEKNGVTAYPNPVDGTALNLSFTNKPAGSYRVVLINSMGQIVFSSSVQHGGGTAVQTLRLNKKPVKGIYRLKVAGKETAVSISITCD